MVHGFLGFVSVAMYTCVCLCMSMDAQVCLLVRLYAHYYMDIGACINVCIYECVILWMHGHSPHVNINKVTADHVLVQVLPDT